MKKNTLKPHRRKKPNYALRSFVWGAAIIAVMIIPSMILDDGMFLFYGDYNWQVLPFYQIMHEAIRSGSFGWNWYTDLGTSLVAGYSYYNLGSPFFWLMIPFPTEAVPYLMGPITILKFGLSSLFAYVFLKRYVKDKNNAVIGSLLYAFSGFAIYGMVFHFEDTLVFFPLLLAALDSFIFEKKRGRFAAMIALCAVVNFYFFFAEAVFCLIYWIVRVSAKNYKMELREVLCLIFEAVMGLGLSLFLLLPSFYSIIGNSRMGSTGDMDGWTYWLYSTPLIYLQRVFSFFFPPELANGAVYIPEYDSSWLSLTCWLPIFAMSGVFAIVFNKRRNKWMRAFYAVCTVILFVPLFNSSFQMFTESKYSRWYFMLLLVMALGSVIALEDPATNWKKSITLNFVLTSIAVVIVGFTPKMQSTKGSKKQILLGLYNDTGEFWILMAIALFNIALCAVLVSLYKKNRKAFRKFACIITAFGVISALSYTFVLGKVNGYKMTELVDSQIINCGDNLQIDDIDQWRSDVMTQNSYAVLMYDEDNVATMDTAQREAALHSTYNEVTGENALGQGYNDNLTMFWRVPGIQCFSSTVSGSIMRLFSGLGYQRTTLSNWKLNLYGIRGLTSVKYFFDWDDSTVSFADENGEPLMPGWKYLDTQNGYKIYENEYAVPMGFTFDSYMLDADFQEIDPAYRHLALMKCLVVHSFDDAMLATASGLHQVFDEDLNGTFTQENYLNDCLERKEISCYDFVRDNKGFEAKIDTKDTEEYVFFSVPFDNGWSAEVNGQKAEIMQVDYGFMAVKVPANTTSTIRFNYHTPGVLYGFFVAGVCGFLLLLYMAALKIQSAPSDDTAGVKNNEDSCDNESSTDTADDTALDKDNEIKEKSDGLEDEKSEDSSKKADSFFAKMFKSKKTVILADDDETQEEQAENPEQSEEQAQSAEEDFEELSLFDIVKQTEEQHMMHTYSRVQVALENGYGSTAYDINGKKYIDFTAGIGVNCLGYANAKWLDAVESQMCNLQHTSNLYYNIAQIQLAETLCLKTGFSKVFFANSGAEANECAIKVARKYGSDKYGEAHTHIVTLENSFHGRTITTLSATGQDVFHKNFQPFTDGFSYAKANDMDSIKKAVSADTCAVMIELVQGEGGVNPLDKDFVAELAEFCKEKDILLIVDEVQTGVGRTGTLFCYERFDIKPDIITSAKALGGGLPLSACLCSEELKDVMTVGSNGTTFGGNPAACAGAQKIIEIVSEESFLADVKAKGEYIKDRLNTMNGVKEVRGLGMMIGIVLESDNAKEVLARCAENGLLVLTAKNLLRLLPPLNIDYYDIDEGLDILEATIEELDSEGE